MGTVGALEVYCRNLKGVTKNGVVLHEGSDYTYDAHARKLNVPFKGATTLVIQGASGIFGQ